MDCPTIHGLKLDNISKSAIERIRNSVRLGNYVSGHLSIGVLQDIFLRNTPIEASYNIYSTDFHEFATALSGVQAIQRNTVKQVALGAHLRSGTYNQRIFWKAIFEGCSK